MHTLLLIRGLPGSGKTTLAVEVADGANHAADDFFETPAGYSFDAARLPQAHAQCQERVRDDLRCGLRLVAAHNTFCARWELEPYIQMADEHGYTVAVVDLFDGGLSDAELAARCEHPVPLDAIAAMRSRYEHDWRSGDVRPPWERA